MSTIFERLNILKEHGHTAKTVGNYKYLCCEPELPIPKGTFRNWMDLPPEMALKIIGYMPTKTRVQLGATSKYNRALVEKSLEKLGIMTMNVNFDAGITESLISVFGAYHHNNKSITSDLKAICIEFDCEDTFAVGIFEKNDSTCCLIWLTDSRDMKVCQIGHVDPDEWLFETAIHYATINRIKTQNLYFVMDIIMSYKKVARWARRFMSCPSMSEIQHLDVRMCNSELVSIFLWPHQPKVLSLTCNYDEDISKILHRCPMIYNIQSVTLYNSLLRRSKFLKFRCEELKIQNSYFEDFDTDIIGDYLRKWMNGKLNPKFQRLYLDSVRGRSCDFGEVSERIHTLSGNTEWTGDNLELRKTSNPDEVGYFSYDTNSMEFVVEKNQ